MKKLFPALYLFFSFSMLDGSQRPQLLSRKNAKNIDYEKEIRGIEKFFESQPVFTVPGVSDLIFAFHGSGHFASKNGRTMVSIYPFCVLTTPVAKSSFYAASMAGKYPPIDALEITHDGRHVCARLATSDRQLMEHGNNKPKKPPMPIVWDVASGVCNDDGSKASGCPFLWRGVKRKFSTTNGEVFAYASNDAHCTKPYNDGTVGAFKKHQVEIWMPKIVILRTLSLRARRHKEPK